MQVIEDNFESDLLPYWVRLCIGNANIEHERGIARLIVHEAAEGILSDAEIDDHRMEPMRWKPPLKMTVRARFSHRAGTLLGTAGFGFWNSPFDQAGNVHAPPNALWFFYASSPGDMRFVRNVRGNGWKAAMWNGGRSNPLEMAAGNFALKMPGMSKLVFRVAETRISAAERLLDELDMTDWHSYSIEWRGRQADFIVDDLPVLSAMNPPRGLLGFVAWVDNNCMTLGPDVDLLLRRLAVDQREWMELSLVKIEEIAG